MTPRDLTSIAARLPSAHPPACDHVRCRVARSRNGFRMSLQQSAHTWGWTKPCRCQHASRLPDRNATFRMDSDPPGSDVFIGFPLWRVLDQTALDTFRHPAARTAMIPATAAAGTASAAHVEPLLTVWLCCISGVRHRTDWPPENHDPLRHRGAWSTQRLLGTSISKHKQAKFTLEALRGPTPTPGRSLRNFLTRRHSGPPCSSPDPRNFASPLLSLRSSDQ